jgi:hypothetical protein
MTFSLTSPSYSISFLFSPTLKSRHGTWKNKLHTGLQPRRSILMFGSLSSYDDHEFSA